MRATARSTSTWHDALNLANLVAVSKVIVRAAQSREDSRGAHFRSDFPDRAMYGAQRSRAFARGRTARSRRRRFRSRSPASSPTIRWRVAADAGKAAATVTAIGGAPSTGRRSDPTGAGVAFARASSSDRGETCAARSATASPSAGSSVTIAGRSTAIRGLARCAAPPRKWSIGVPMRIPRRREEPLHVAACDDIAPGVEYHSDRLVQPQTVDAHAAPPGDVAGGRSKIDDVERREAAAGRSSPQSPARGARRPRVSCTQFSRAPAAQQVPRGEMRQPAADLGATQLAVVELHVVEPFAAPRVDFVARPRAAIEADPLKGERKRIELRDHVPVPFSGRIEVDEHEHRRQRASFLAVQGGSARLRMAG